MLAMVSVRHERAPLMLLRRLRVAIAAALLLVTLPAVVSNPDAALAVSVPTRPTGTDPWLETANWWRSLGAATDGTPFPAVTNLPADNVGPQNHVDYLTYVWSLGSTYCGHGEDPAFPKSPGTNYWHNVLFCSPSTLTAAVDGWMNTPYHAPPLLAPNVTRIGAARGTGTMSGGPGYANAAVTAATSPITKTYLWPANGGALPRTRMMTGETPDPTAICPPLSGQPLSQPVFAWFPTNRVFVSSTVTDDAGQVPHCALGLATGATTNKVTVIAKRPWTAGTTVTASLITTAVGGADPQTLTWSFTVVDIPAANIGRVAGGVDGATVTITDPTAVQSGGSPILERELRLFASGAAYSAPPLATFPLAGVGTFEIPAAAGTYFWCLASRNAVGWSSCSSRSGVNITAGPYATAVPTAGFTAVTPQRLLDTRAPGAQFGRLAPQAINILDLRTLMPAGTVAVALNVTATNSAVDGWVRLYPCTDAVPSTSNLNPSNSHVVTNAAVVPVGDGRLCVQSLGATDLVIDVNGWLTKTATSGLVVTQPKRLLDTRTANPVASRLSAGQTVTVQVVAPDSAADAVSINVTAVDPGGNGFITVYPCGTDRPLASNLNPTSGVTAPNQVNIGVGSGRSVCIFTTVATDLVVDLFAEFRPGAPSRFAPITPTRVLDTRTILFDNTPAGTPYDVNTGRVDALQANLTAVGAPSAGWLSTYACATDIWPGTSNVNFPAATAAANAALMPASRGKTCVKPSLKTHIVIDIFGVWKS